MENIIDPLFTIALYPFITHTYFVLAPVAMAFVMGLMRFVQRWVRRNL